MLFKGNYCYLWIEINAFLWKVIFKFTNMNVLSVRIGNKITRVGEKNSRSSYFLIHPNFKFWRITYVMMNSVCGNAYVPLEFNIIIWILLDTWLDQFRILTLLKCYTSFVERESWSHVDTSCTPIACSALKNSAVLNLAWNYESIWNVVFCLFLLLIDVDTTFRCDNSNSSVG